MSKLVAYFSASGVTGEVAGMIAKAANADTFEIRPEVPYSDADLKWTNPLARCNKEKIGKKDVPFVGEVENFDTYDTIFIGFPIWYYTAPNIIQTFLKQYDFSNKKVALFATSGGTEMTKIADKLKPMFSASTTIIDSKLFHSSDGSEVIQAWVDQLNE